MKLKTQVGGFSFSGYKPKRTKLDKPQVLYRNYQGTLPAKADPVHVPKRQVILTPEMAERERQAQLAIKEKMKTVMPIFNKGGNQLPTASDLEDFKAGLLRRRS